MEKRFPYFSSQPAKKDFPSTCKSCCLKIDKEVSVSDINVDAAVGSDTNINLKYQNSPKKHKGTKQVSKLCSTDSLVHCLEFSKDAAIHFNEEVIKSTSTPFKENENKKSPKITTGKKLDFCSSSTQTEFALTKEKRNNVYPDPFDRMIIQTLELYKRIFMARDSFKKLVKCRKDAKMRKRNYCRNQGLKVSKNYSVENKNDKFPLLVKENLEKGTKNNGGNFCRCGSGCSTDILNRCCCKK